MRTRANLFTDDTRTLWRIKEYVINISGTAESSMTLAKIQLNNTRAHWDQILFTCILCVQYIIHVD